MQLLELIDRLLPGDVALSVPCFTEAVGESVIEAQGALMHQVMQRMAEYQGHSHVSAVEDPEGWVTAFLTFFSQQDPQTYQQFRLAIIGNYMASDTVLSGLGEDLTPLFPRGQPLPTMTFDLLETVYNRGPLWRPIDSTIKSTNE